MRGDWTWIIGFYMCVYSVMPVQLYLLSIGLVFERASFSKRLFIYCTATMLVVAMWNLWLYLANWVGKHEPNHRGNYGMLYWMPLYALTLQTPLWIAKLCTRWHFDNRRVASADALPAQQNSFRFSISQLLTFTTLAAVVIAFYRQLTLWLGDWIPPFVPEILPEWCRCIALSLAIVPAVIGWLAPTRFSYLVAWLATLLYSTIAVAVATAFYVRFLDLYLDHAEFHLIATMALAFTMLFTSGLCLLRAYGWRLVKTRLPANTTSQ